MTYFASGCLAYVGFVLGIQGLTIRFGPLQVLDEDGSGDIEWGEFIEALSALERGTRVQRIEFLFQVRSRSRIVNALD